MNKRRKRRTVKPSSVHTPYPIPSERPKCELEVTNPDGGAGRLTIDYYVWSSSNGTREYLNFCITHVAGVEVTIPFRAQLRRSKGVVEAAQPDERVIDHVLSWLTNGRLR